MKIQINIALIVLLLAAGYGLYSVMSNVPAGVAVNKSSTRSTVAGVKIGGEMALTDHNGADVTQATYADFYKLMFFGFTYCPAVCPTELQRMGRVMDDLGPTADKIQPIFISVDPERDTPQSMHDYVANFHPRLVGLTGTRPQIDKVLADFRIYAARTEMPGMEGDTEHYMMDHSAYMYLISPGADGELISIFRAEDSVEMIVDDVKGRLN